MRTSACVRAISWVIVFGALSGCPFGPSESGSDRPTPTRSAVDTETRASELPTAGSPELEQLVSEATRDRFPLAPPLETLCKLRVLVTDFSEVLELLGPTDSASQDGTMAGLSYRFRARPKGEGGAGGKSAATDALTAESVSIVLLFTWEDGHLPGSTPLPGAMLKSGYVLSEMSVTGMPYPDCWPHKDPDI